MLEVIESETFKRWRRGLKDRTALLRINARIGRLALGQFGDAKALREGIAELRIDHGPGYRVYFMRRGRVTVILLAGGDKRTQDTDIERAIQIARQWEESS